MLRQIRFVLWSYGLWLTSSPFMVLMALLLSVPIMAGIAFLFTTARRDSGPDAANIFFWLTGVGALAIGLFLKEQTVFGREHRLPRFHPPHFVTALALLICIGLSGPLLVAVIIHQASWGLVGLTVMANALMLIAGIMGVQYIGFYFFFFMAISQVPGAIPFIKELRTGQRETAGILLLFLGLALVTATLRRLVNMTEEVWNYRSPVAWRNGVLVPRPVGDPATTRQWKKLLFGNFYFPNPTEEAISAWPRWGAGSLWQRIRLWNVAFGSSRGIVVMPVVVLVILMIGKLRLHAWNSDVLSTVRTGIRMGTLPWLVMMPVMLNFVIIFQRQATFSMESLRPVARRRLLLECGLTLVLRSAGAWLIMAACWLLAVAAWTGTFQIERQDLAALALAGAVQIPFLALGVWLSRYRSRALSVLFAVPMGAGLPISSVLLGSADWYQVSTLTIALILLAIIAAGLLILWDAYRRWLRTELG